MKKLLFILTIFTAIFFGCGNNIEIVQLEITKVWNAENLTPANSDLCIEVKKDGIYYVKTGENSFGISKRNFDGKEISEFKIPVGKGPGEAMHSLGLGVNDNSIYFTDFVLKRITKFSFEGEYKDSFNLGNETGMIISFDFYKDFLFYHSINISYLGKMNIKTGKVLNSVEHDIKKMIGPGDKLKGGIMVVDKFDNNIYVGGISKPYKIEKFDMNFNKIDEFKYDVGKGIEPTKVAPGPNIYGDMLISSMVCDENYLYTPEISNRTDIKGNDRTYKKFDGRILVFDKNSGELVKIYENEKLKNIKGSFTISGLTENYIVTFINGYGETGKRLTGKDDKYQNIFLLLKRPEIK